MYAEVEVGDLDAVCKRWCQARVLDVVRGVLDVHQVVCDTEASSYETGHRVDDEHREVLVSHLLIWTAGDDRAASGVKFRIRDPLSGK